MTEQITDLIFDDLKRDVVERAKRNQTINSPSTLFNKKKAENGGGSDLMELARQVEEEGMEEVEEVEEVEEEVVEEVEEEEEEEKKDPMEDSSDVVVIEEEEEEEESISYLEDADSVAENTAGATTVATPVEEEDDDMYDFDDFSSTTASSSLPALPGMNNTNDGGSSDYDPMNDGNTIPNERGTVPAAAVDVVAVAIVAVVVAAVPAVAHPPSSASCCCCRCCLYRFGVEARGGHFDRHQTVAPAWAGIPASTVPPHWSLHRQSRRRKGSLCSFASPWKFDEQRGRGRGRKPNFDSGLCGVGKTKCCVPLHSWRKYVDR